MLLPNVSPLLKQPVSVAWVDPKLPPQHQQISWECPERVDTFCDEKLETELTSNNYLRMQTRKTRKDGSRNRFFSSLWLINEGLGEGYSDLNASTLPSQFPKIE